MDVRKVTDRKIKSFRVVGAGLPQQSRTRQPHLVVIKNLDSFCEDGGTIHKATRNALQLQLLRACILASLCLQIENRDNNHM